MSEARKRDLWMPLNVGDYLADTGHLTTVQHGAYLLLIMHYWRKRGLPDDDRQLAAIAKLPLRIWLDCRPTIQMFFTDGSGGPPGSGWHSKRVEQELSKRAAIAAKRAANGKLGGDTTAFRREVANAPFCSSKTHTQRNITTTASVERGLGNGNVSDDLATNLRKRGWIAS